MAHQSTSAPEPSVVAYTTAAWLLSQLHRFVTPLLVELDHVLDKRLVRTFLCACRAIIEHRHRNSGLLLSELGAFITSPLHAPAGTKRLSNLLRSGRWSHQLVEQFLWRGADERLRELEATGQEALLLWDESVMEKPESLRAEGLSAVRSIKAERLKRIKPGYYTPPGSRPIFVPGLHWFSLMLMGTTGPPVLVSMRWWSSRGAHASDRRSQARRLLRETTHAWTSRVIHLFDRGFAGAPWLEALFEARVRFILRWPKHYKLDTPEGEQAKAWQLLRGKRCWGYRMLFDTHKRTHRRVGVVARQVRFGLTPLWLVASRPGKGRAPWYLLTNQPVQREQAAWEVVLAYARRWQVEMAWRYSKSELAMESPRLWFWQNRLKLLSIVTLVYAFLLTLLRPEAEALRRWLLRHFCHRTGKRSREVSTPLYRLRIALSQLWIACRPSGNLQTPG